MSNHVFNSEESEDLQHLYSEENSTNTQQKGGDSNSKETVDYPSGGFPPIFIVTDPKEKEAEKARDRQLISSKSKTTISIKDILKSKK